MFNDPTFRPALGSVDESFVAVTEKYISNIIVHEVRLDQGEVALAWLDNKYACVLLVLLFFGLFCRLRWSGSLNVQSFFIKHYCYVVHVSRWWSFCSLTLVHAWAVRLRPLLLGASALFGRESAIDKYNIDIESDDDDHRYYKIESPTFRMMMRNGKPVFLQIGAEQIIQHATILVIRVRQVLVMGCSVKRSAV